MGKNGPNKTVAAFRRRNPFAAPLLPPDAFTEWVANQARNGQRFKTLEEAHAAFQSETA